MKKILQSMLIFILCGQSACAGMIYRSDVVSFNAKPKEWNGPNNEIEKTYPPIASNSCIFMIARESILSDIPFIVCKTQNVTLKMQCKNGNMSQNDIKNLISGKSDDFNCKDSTITKTIETNYIFPNASVSGGWSSISTIGAATLGAGAVVGAARIK